MFQTNTAGKINVIKQNTSSDVKVAIVGINQIVRKIFQNLDPAKVIGRNLIGFINIDPIDKGSDLSNLPRLLGGIGEIQSIIRKYGIKKILVAIDTSNNQKLMEIIQYCENENVEYELLNNTSSGSNNSGNYTSDNNLKESNFQNGSNVSVKNGGLALGYSNGNPTIEEKRNLKEVVGELIETKPPDREFIFQRAIDLIASIILFLLFLPSWLVVAVAIKLESKGDVLYTQERVGQGGKIFKIYKFRSMYSDAEKRSGPTLATHNDPRITKVGRILRRTRIDELPQLVNVIKGDMSLIGPRPERPYFTEKYDEQIPRYLERLKVKPGLTGFAQVETGYDESIEDVKIKLEYDLYYISHRSSFKLYFKIMLKTVWVVLTAKGQ